MPSIFYVFQHQPTTYDQFAALVELRARALSPFRGQVVGVWANQGPDFIVDLFAIWRVSAVPFLISRCLPWPMVSSLLEDAGASVLVTSDVDRCGASPVPVIACDGGSGGGAVESTGESTDIPSIGCRGQDVALILHTSGTTNLPKLVRITRANLEASLRLEESRWHGLWTERDTSLGWLPLYHSFGLISELLHVYRTKSRYYFTEATPGALLQGLEQAPITLLSAVPWMLEQLLELPGGAAALARLRWVVVAGAVLDEELGERLVSAGVRVIQQYGMTELGAVFRGLPDGDWRDMTPVIPDAFWHLEAGTGQLIIHGDCPVLASPSPGQEFATRDTFQRTPSGAYRYGSWLDDVLVHVNGEKTNALAIEHMLGARLGQRVEHVVVVGAGRLRLACILQWKHAPAAEDHGALSQALDEVNAELPSHSQLHRELVLSLTPADAGRLPLTARGAVMRSKAEQVFQAELAELYGELPRAAPEARAACGQRWRILSPRAARVELRALVRSVAAEVRGSAGPDGVDPSRGFADQGFDSVMAVRLAAALGRALGVALPATLAFDYPTVDAVVEHLASDVLDLERRAERRAVQRDAVHEPIAIIGAACRLPAGVEDLASFWRLLVDGGVVAGDVPADRWDGAAWYDADPDAPGRSYTRRGGFLRDVQSFDAAFFGVSPREAVTMDPQQRLLLEVGWEALEHARLAPEVLRQRATGVFVGVSAVDYAERLDVNDASAMYIATGGAHGTAAGRLSYFLGLRGPSLTVDTACSSSLTAVHLACQSLRQGECEQALVGAANLLLSEKSFIALSRMRAVSPDGQCKPFSAAADGFGRAEGCVVVVLKRLSEAQRDGDPILALIRGTAVNHDGPSSGLTVPNGLAQQELVRTALDQAGLAPAEVDLVECHGTGTPLGDPIEVQALAAVLGQQRPAGRPVVLGGVKANLGHLEAAAGLAGLLKVVLALEHGEIPAQPPFAELNPHIPWSQLPVEVAREPRAWPRGDRARIAGVSSFGLSGTNAHVVLQEAPSAPSAPAADAAERAELCVVSARNPRALAAAAARLGDHVRAHPEVGVAELASSLAVTRGHLEHRLSVTASTREALAGALEAAARGEAPPGVARGRVARGGVPRLVFVFPGQGSQWLGMGRQLIRDEPVFRAALEQCDAAIRAEAGFSVIERLAADETSAELERPEVVQPMLFAMAVAQATLWRAWGVEPDAVVGHSMGEVAAAHVAGALSLADAAAIICRRGRLLRRIRGQGEMALVEMSWIQAEAALLGYADRLCIAVSNGPRSTVIAGERAALSAVLHRLDRRGVFCRRVPVDFAGHSAQVDPLRDDLIAALSALQPRAATVPMRSTVTGEWIAGPELRAAYWADNLRQPVRFLHTIEALLEDGHGLFVEVSPHPILAPTITEIARAAGRACVAVGSTRRGMPERSMLLDALGVLHVHGYPLAWDRMFPAGGRRVPLPTYPWERQRYWIDVSSRAGRATRVVRGAAGVADTDAASAAPCALAPGWRELSASERHDTLSSHLQAQAASVLGLRAPRLDPERALSEQGMDSMMAAELSNRIHNLGVTLRLRQILEGASVATLTDFVLAQLGRGERMVATDQPDAGQRTERNPWLHVVKRNPHAAVRLVCFPYAGGGPPVFARWPEDLPDSVELGVVHLPGRGSRSSETRLVRMEQVVEALTPAIAMECAGQPFAFLGHSLGAMIMFEVAHRLRRDHGQQPAHLFVSGARAPHCYHPEQIRKDFLQYSGGTDVPGHELPESQLLEMIHDLGFGASRGLERDEELRRLMLSTFRADFEINNTYAYADRPALDTPITAMGGRVDPFVNAEQLLAWSRHTTGAFSASFCSGGHDFIEQQRPLWVQVLTRELGGPVRG